MLPSTRPKAAPLIVQRLRNALRPPSTPPPIGIAAARTLCQPAQPSASASPSPKRRLTTLLTGGAVLTGAAYALSDPDGAQQTLTSARDAIDERIRFFAEPSREKLLPDLAPMYAGAEPPRTLVVDLERTLVYSTYSRATGWRVAKRPGAEAFLAYLAGFYEIVVFTSALNTYADPILDRLDPNGYIAHRLYRAETHYRNGVHVKNLEHLNRRLERVVVVDCDERQVGMQRGNAVVVSEWTGDPGDTALLDLIPFLESLVKRDVKDVRVELELLGEGDIGTRVAEYSAVVEAREKMEAAQMGGSLFGHSANAGSAGVGERREEEEGAKGAVWGSLSGTSKVFHGQGAKGAE